jgi:hypothetical protein
VVLADDHEVDVLPVEDRAHALVLLAGTQARVEVELLAQRDVDRAEARADGSRDRTLDGDLVLLDRLEDAVGEGRALGLVDVSAGLLPVPLELDAGGFEHFRGRIRDLGAGAVPADEGDSVGHGFPFSPSEILKVEGGIMACATISP